MMRRRAPVLLVAALLAFPAPALADGVRTRGTCGGRVQSELELKPDHGQVEVRFRLDRARANSLWRIVLTHEGSVAWRGRARTNRGGGFRVERSVPDYGGADRVMVRATGPSGWTCTAVATLPGTN